MIVTVLLSFLSGIVTVIFLMRSRSGSKAFVPAPHNAGCPSRKIAGSAASGPPFVQVAAGGSAVSG